MDLEELQLIVRKLQSSQAESLGNDLLRSSEAGIRNCRALLDLDGLTPKRQALLRKSYYRYVSLALSNIGGTVAGSASSTNWWVISSPSGSSAPAGRNPCNGMKENSAATRGNTPVFP